MIQKLFRFLIALILVLSSLFVVSLSISFVRYAWFSGKSFRRPYVAVLDIKGVIVDASDVLRKVREIQEHPGAKALLVRINSPGGLVAPSQEMYQALRRVDEKIPVVVSMGSVAASGGYYAALGGRTVFANPGTLTASIGVIMEFANLEKLYQWAKVDRFTIKAGKMKDAGSPFRPMTPEEKAYFEGLAKNIHHEFRKAVQVRRKIKEEALENLADGRVLTGTQAFEAKLVDHIGTEEDAVKEAKKLAGLPDQTWVDYPKVEEGLLKKLLFGSSDVDEESRSSLAILAQVASQALHPGYRLLMLAPISP